jgi:predicted Zn finger-like uncharacterized protein
VIVACEQCTTQFQLDDAKVPARGVRVRCSRCKHAFFVKPHAEAGGAVERAVERALDDDTTSDSSALEDWVARGGGTLGDGVSPLDAAGEESDWEFNHDPEPAEDIGDPLQLDLSEDIAGEAVDDLLDVPDAEFDADGAGDLVGDIGDELGLDLGNDVDLLLAGADDAPGLALDSGLDLGGEPPTGNLDVLGEADEGHDALGPVSLDGGSFPAEDAEPESAAQAPLEFDLLESDSSDGDGLDSGQLADAEPGDRVQPDSDLDALFASEASQPEPEAVPLREPEQAAMEPGLGSPESWEFFENGGDDAADRVMTMRIPLGRMGSTGQRPPVEVDKETSRVGVWLGRAINGVGWSAVAVLALIGFRAGIGASLAAPTGSTTGLHQVSESVELADLTQAWVDNATAGTLYVLSGKLRGSGSSRVEPGSRFEVRLLDATGEPLGIEPAALGPPLTAAELRTQSPAELRARLARQANATAWVALAPGGSRRVQAVIASVPERAVRFDVLAVSAPALRRPQHDRAAQETAPEPAASPTSRP